MYARCPKCGAESAAQQTCPKCGVIFAKYLKTVVGGAPARAEQPAAACLWWAAVAVIDTAPYVYDAYQPQHILLSGRTGDTGSHDFIDVLGDLGLLNKAQPIGYGVRVFGVGMMAVALAWGASMLWLQYQNRSRLD